MTASIFRKPTRATELDRCAHAKARARAADRWQQLNHAKRPGKSATAAVVERGGNRSNFRVLAHALAVCNLTDGANPEARQ